MDVTRESVERQQLSELFGVYRAEQLRESIFDLYTEPRYFPELRTPHSCLLVGGRGTGKTTVLRALSYEGQFALQGKDPSTLGAWPSYGFYYRVNTNRVSAFQGAELNEPEWGRLFSHYLNLVLSKLILQFLNWYGLYAGQPLILSDVARRKVAASLSLPADASGMELAAQIDFAVTAFEAYVNNVVDGARPALSMLGAPVDALLEAVRTLPPFTDKHFFFIIDEYENFLDYQQQVVNTLIKQAGELYAFKIGVRELGWRRRTTLNANEQLISPADYIRIDISEQLSGERFRDFAKAVCEDRLKRISPDDADLIRDVEVLLPGLSEEAEAELLGVREAVASTIDALRNVPKGERIVELFSPLQIYMLEYWSKGKTRHLASVVDEYFQRPSEWTIRYENYKYALLFTLRRGKRGIRKYYSGWNTFAQLAGSNIRYLLELVDQSLVRHLQDSHSLATPVDVQTQTIAAQDVGRDNLKELEGLSVHGAALTKLVLGLGRVFGIMAADAEGHAPEVNQFYLSNLIVDSNDDSEGDTIEAQWVLNAAVMHLALLRSPGSKLTEQTDTREYEYWLHPVFAPFFVYSHRRKRKIKLGGNHILGLVNHPRATIKEILGKTRRYQEGESLPEQLSLFERYYAAGA